MRKKFVLYRRGTVYYAEDVDLHRRTSLQTRDRHQAEKLIHAKNDALLGSATNLAIARAYLGAADSQLAQRTWSLVMEEFISRSGRDSTRVRRERAMRSQPFCLIRDKKIIGTTADDFRAVLKAGGVFTHHSLRCLHHLAIGLGWLPWAILPPKLWPRLKSAPKRAITWQEHQHIVQAEKNSQRRLYYELVWETGAAQSDAANLTNDNIDWQKRQLSFERKKTSEWCFLQIGPRLEAVLKQLPADGLLFPNIASLPDTSRSAEFHRRCKLLGIRGVSLHSYRYAWAQRARILGVPERFAQQALGHSSKAVHWAYARDGVLVCPSLEHYE